MGLQSPAQDAEAKWIKVLFHLPELPSTPAFAAREMVGVCSRPLLYPVTTD